MWNNSFTALWASCQLASRCLQTGLSFKPHCREVLSQRIFADLPQVSEEYLELDWARACRGYVGRVRPGKLCPAARKQPAAASSQNCTQHITQDRSSILENSTRPAAVLASCDTTAKKSILS